MSQASKRLPTKTAGRSYGLPKYIQSVIRKDKLPSVSRDGHVYTNPDGGTSKRKYLTKNEDKSYIPERLQRFLGSNYPHGHFEYTTAPERRCAKHKSIGQMHRIRLLLKLIQQMQHKLL